TRLTAIKETSAIRLVDVMELPARRRDPGNTIPFYNGRTRIARTPYVGWVESSEPTRDQTLPASTGWVPKTPPTLHEFVIPKQSAIMANFEVRSPILRVLSQT